MAKTKALFSFAVIAKLICVYVFAYAKCLFSHDAAQMSYWLAAKAASHTLGPFSDTESYFRRSSSLGDFIRHALGSLFLHLGLLRQTPCTNNKREQTISSPIGTIRTLLYPYHTLPLP